MWLQRDKLLDFRNQTTASELAMRFGPRIVAGALALPGTLTIFPFTVLGTYGAIALAVNCVRSAVACDQFAGNIEIQSIFGFIAFLAMWMVVLFDSRKVAKTKFRALTLTLCLALGIAIAAWVCLSKLSLFLANGFSLVYLSTIVAAVLCFVGVYSERCGDSAP